MKHKDEFYSGKSTFVILITGIAFCLLGAFILSCYGEEFTIGHFSNLLLSIGCSIVAAALIPLLLQKAFGRYMRKHRLLSKWGVSGIYQTRADMNAESNRDIEKCSLYIDICALGLTGLRSHLRTVLEEKVKNGVKIRFLSPSPDSKFLAYRDAEEENENGQLKKNIESLIEWVNSLKQKAQDPGNVEIRVYHDKAIQNSYMRVDNKIFIGPYLYKTLSQQTISFSFIEGDTFDYYSQYFNRLWADTAFCAPPASLKE